MDAQLRLLAPDEAQTDWRLDDDTREAGRRGVALARQALRDARRGRSAEDEASAA